LFSLGCGRLFEGSPEQMHASLQRLASLPGDTLVCCTHEYSASNARFALNVDPGNAKLRDRAADIAAARARGDSSLPVRLGSELACNPFLRCDRDEIRAAAEQWTGASLPSAHEVFGALRAWKDAFR
jgi:hydroxyacylglutathione hydrolase